MWLMRLREGDMRSTRGAERNVFKQWTYDFKRAPTLQKVLLVGLFPLYPLYRLHRKRRAYRKSARNPYHGGVLFPSDQPIAITRLADLSGTLKDVDPVPPDAKEEAELALLDDSFALCRIVGNDLEPRHQAGQSLANVQFILDHEADFEGVQKLWLLNRIFNPETEANVIQLLEDRQQVFRRIPFKSDEYQTLGYRFDTFKDKSVFYDGRLDVDPSGSQTMQAILQAYQPRNNYVMNNNGARNAALSFCLEHGKWALPFDGNCFLTTSSWEAIRSDILRAKDKRYFVVPMTRITDNSELLDQSKSFEAKEEPQIAFRCDAPLRFNESHPYGRRPKVELFLHLGISGPWDRWHYEPFDELPRKVDPEGHRVGRAGWVARLASGKGHLEAANRKAIVDRGVARSVAIRATLDMLGGRCINSALNERTCLTYREPGLVSASPADVEALKASAVEALTRGPFSVMHKSQPGPSGDKHDYFHPAPYWHPNPNSKDGLPYVRRDGERLRGTELYEPESDAFDRTRLQRLFDDTIALVQASLLPDADPAFRARACENLRTWFIDPDTAMSPHLKYAQVRMGHNDNAGAANGLIETKDFYFLFDAVRLLDDPEITAGMKEWSARFLNWFLEGEQGRRERANKNNHGVCYDLQAAALAAFLKQPDFLQAIDMRAQARALDTITPEGDQPHELERTLTQHYCAFNLQSWINLFDLLTAAGMRPWKSDAGERIQVALQAMLTMSMDGWAHPQIKPFDEDRLIPLNEALKNQTGEDVLGRDASEGPVSFYPHDGVAPFWRLTRLGAAT